MIFVILKVDVNFRQKFSLELSARQHLDLLLLAQYFEDCNHVFYTPPHSLVANGLMS